MKNMWNGKLYSKSLDRLQLVYLRTSLAPKDEAKYIELIQKKKQEKRNGYQHEATVSVDSIRQVVRRSIKNVKKMQRKLGGVSRRF